jgi:hypothetical protein
VSTYLSVYWTLIDPLVDDKSTPLIRSCPSCQGCADFVVYRLSNSLWLLPVHLRLGQRQRYSVPFVATDVHFHDGATDFFFQIVLYNLILLPVVQVYHVPPGSDIGRNDDQDLRSMRIVPEVAACVACSQGKLLRE